MDTYSSGEDLLIKTRKPYTITKQRERWTEEEHNRFLEALKLYGRAWQRIEEHIGTKTAVQIRSHAQKFFTKLEKEALVKGVPVGQALDIEIPPPRPKRKPSIPYPRKTGVEALNPPVGAKDVSSCCHSIQILDLEKEPLPEKPGGDRKPENAKENENDENCSEILTLFHEAPCPSADKKESSTPVASRNLCTSSKCVRMMEEVINQDEKSESHITTEPKETQKLAKLDSEHLVPNNGANNTSNMGNPNRLHAKLVQGMTTSEQSQLENFSTLTSNDMQATQHYPRHVPVHVLDGSPGMSIRNISPHMLMEGVNNGHHNLFANPTASATTVHHNASSSSVHQSFPTLHPLFTPIRNNQEADQSLLHISSTFSSLIVSSLLQNPAAHAAASFAATFLPSATMESSADSLAGTFPLRQMNPAPSMAAIAAATVAAATSWWAAHGLLPLGSPYHPAFTFNPASTTVCPIDADQTATPNNERGDNATHDPPLHDQQQDTDNSKSPTLSSSNSEGSQGAKLNSELSPTNLVKKAEGRAEIHDANTVKSRKQVDRSSCGSNTPSSSDVEPDALEKNEKDKEESKEPDLSHQAGDSNIRRGVARSFGIINDSWKEVSEEGRVAFRALFSREVLPQSFSPPHSLKSKVHQKNNFEKDKNEDEQYQDGSRLDLNSKTWGTFSSSQGVENNEFKGCVNNGEEGLLLMGLGQGKLKAHRTGFKPYKRCSVEANESIVSSKGEEKGPKRIRLEGDAST